MKIWLCALIVCWMIASPVLSQDAASGARYAIRGTVFDSMAGGPLAGAVVQVAARESERAPHTAVTDHAGRFVVSQLPAGSFVIGFYHDNLTALGLDAPFAAVELGRDSVLTVNLAVPSPATVRALRCGGDTTANAGGMLVGFLRDAEGGLAVPEAMLRLSWGALALDSANYRTVTERATAVISPDGSFVACHLPVDATLDLEVMAPGHRTVTGAVAVIPASGVARLDLALVDTARMQGTSRIRGHVSRPNGKPATSGRAVIAALSRDVPIRDGAFLLNDIPPGSWVVETRVIGSEPQSLLVSANDSVTTAVEMRVGEALQRLEAVTVIGKRDANTRLLEEVLRRKRIGMGTVFLPGSPALRSATFTSDVMKEARGFQYRGPTEIIGRTGCIYTAVYVDDLLQPDGFVGLDAVARPSDVLAIETFPDILLAPVQYRIAKTVLDTYAWRRPKTDPLRRPDTYCAVVLVWTKNRPSR